MDNKRISEIIERLDGKAALSSPNFQARMNRLIAEQVSLLTSMRRFGGQGFLNFSELATNLQIYPRCNFFSFGRGDVQDRKSHSESMEIQPKTLH